MNNLNIRKSLFLLAVVLWIVLARITSPIPYAQAQVSQPHWTIPQQVPGYLDDTFTPFLIVDKNRTVHAFANQSVGESDQRIAIVYRKWMIDRGWTPSIDVILLPGMDVGILGTFIDDNSIIHIVFWGSRDAIVNLYYSKAPVALADQARAWSEPKVIGTNIIDSATAGLQGDDKGNLVVVYGSGIDGNGVYTTQSSDSGENWTEPAPIFFSEDPVNFPYVIRLIADSENQMHATWGIVSPTGNNLSLHYARYNVENDSWSEVILLDERVDQSGYFGPAYPTIAENGNEIVVFYNNGNTNANGPVGLGRPVQMMVESRDGGFSWSKPSVPFPQYLGRSGEHTIAVDSNGVVHAIFIQRIDQTIDGQYLPISGIWHSEYRDNRWSQPERIPVPFDAHDIRSVVSQGNVLLATWRADPGVGQFGVYYSYKVLDAPELPVETPTIPENTPAQVATSVISPKITSGEISPQPTVGVSNNWLAAEPAGNQFNPGVWLMIGLAPVVFVLLAFVLIRRFNH
jgi:hypothetical protein